MIAIEEDIFPQREYTQDRINLLRRKIHDEDYLYEAIQRIAQVLSNEICGFRREGKLERKG